MQSGLNRELEVREGETTSVDLVLREILVAGHVTRSGSPAPGLRIEAFGQRQFMLGGMPSTVPAAASSGPQRMQAVTREDGGYEMIVDEPGSIRLSVMSADGRQRLPMRTAEVPDADAFTLDLAYMGVSLTGVVVDKETEAPIAYASVFARSKTPEGTPRGASGTSGPDGRFQIEIEPGDYVMGANVREGDYGQAEAEVRVGEAGVSDVRLALPKGLAISGKVTDAAGRGVSAILVRAVPPEEGPRPWSMNQSLGDGSFRLTGLNQGTYTVVAQSDSGAFALRTGVAAGTKTLGLVLQPGVRIALRVVGPGGQAEAGAWPTVTKVDGVPVGSVGRAFAPTDAQGTTELLAPSGHLTIEVGKEKLRGTGTVSAAAGEPASLTVALKEQPAP